MKTKWTPRFEFDPHTGSVTGFLYEWEEVFDGQEFDPCRASIIVRVDGIDPTKNKEGQWVPSCRCERWRRFILFASAPSMSWAIATATDKCLDILDELFCFGEVGDKEEEEVSEQRSHNPKTIEEAKEILEQLFTSALEIESLVDELHSILAEGAYGVLNKIPFDDDGEEGEE